MSNSYASFWSWFQQFASQLRDDSDISEEAMDELLAQLHQIDERIYVQIAVDDSGNELILTAEGDTEAFPLIDDIVAHAPSIPGWTVFSLKPPMGFEFSIDNEGVEMNAEELWFVPMRRADAPEELGLQIAAPNADRMLAEQTIDLAWTILEVGLGERLVSEAIHHVQVVERPANPEEEGYLRLSDLPQFLTQ